MKKAHSYLAVLFFLAGIAQPVRAQSDDPALIRTFKGHFYYSVNSVAFSQDGRHALSGSYDKFLKLWDVASGRAIRTFKGHSTAVYSVAFSPDGRHALSGSWDKSLKLWDVASGREIRTFKGHFDFVWSVAFSPDGRNALSGGSDKTLKLWEVSSGQAIRTFKGHFETVHSVAFSPDGRYALSGGFKILKLWEVSSGQAIRTFKGHSSFVYSVAFSPDGEYALSGSGDKTLKLWEVSSGRAIRTLKGHFGDVHTVSFSPDGRYALSGGDDKTLKLWEVSSGRIIRTFDGHSETVRSVVFSPDGRYALSGSNDNTLKLWDVSPWTKPTEKALAEADTPPRPKPKKKPPPRADNTPPTIQIYEPITIARGMKRITQSNKDVLVKGRATDESGIYEVLVNGQEVPSLDAQGYFWAEVKLTVGENKIYVKATDIHGNEGGATFTVVREAEARPPPEVAEETTGFQFGEYHALLIAVQDYDDRTLHDLDYPLNDVQRLKKVLQTYYTFDSENVDILHNPDERDILRKFNELRDTLSEKDNLLIFYAGHGYWDADLQQGYWLPRDARQSDQAAWISNSDIRDQIRGLKTKHTLLISDACFSGGIFRTREAFIQPDISVQKVFELSSRKALTSGNLKTVPDRSVFVEFLAKRLEQNREPYLYSEELYLMMRDAVTNNSPNNQTPLFGVVNGAGDEGGDFIFVQKR